MSIIYSTAALFIGIGLGYYILPSADINMTGFDSWPVETAAPADSTNSTPLTDLSDRLDDDKQKAAKALYAKECKQANKIARQYLKEAKDHGIILELVSVAPEDNNNLRWVYTYRAADGLWAMKSINISCLGYDHMTERLYKVSD